MTDIPLRYLKHLQDFVARNGGTTPLGPWLATLDDDALDTLVEAVDAITRRGERLPNGLSADLIGCVIEILCRETPDTTRLEYSVEQMHEFLFALGICGALEQLCRAGWARILSPMILTSGFMPQVEMRRVEGDRNAERIRTMGFPGPGSSWFVKPSETPATARHSECAALR
jgi:hypothetical protein